MTDIVLTRLAALHPTMRERARYAAGRWAHRPRWRTYDAGGDTWFGFAGATPTTTSVRPTRRPPACPGLRAFRRFMAMDERVRSRNLERLGELRASGDADVFCAHAAADLDRFALDPQELG